MNKNQSINTEIDSDSQQYEEEKRDFIRDLREYRGLYATRRYLFVPSKFRNDRAVMLEAIRTKSCTIEVTSEELRADRDFMLEALFGNPRLLQYASDEIQSDRDFILTALRDHRDILKYVKKNFTDDREIVVEAVKHYGWSLQYASQRLRADREIVLEAVKRSSSAKDGNAIQYASPELQADPEIIYEAIYENGDALKYAPKKVIEKLQQAYREATTERFRPGNYFTLCFAPPELLEKVRNLLGL